MRLHGSILNRIAECGIKGRPEPVVGMGATRLMYSDRVAGTIVEVKRDGRELVFQPDKATRTDSNGMSESQRYSFERDPTAPTRTYTLRKGGRYVEKGASARSGEVLAIGYRDHYHDFSF